MTGTISSSNLQNCRITFETYLLPFSDRLSSSALIFFKAGSIPGLGLIFLGESADKDLYRKINLCYKRMSKLQEHVPVIYLKKYPNS